MSSRAGVYFLRLDEIQCLRLDFFIKVWYNKRRTGVTGLNREEAFYYKNLLLLGFSDGYDDWLNDSLETESPLSDVVLELSLCGSDVKKTVSVLHNYCNAQEFDEAVSHDKLRLFFKEAYYANRMSKEEVLSAMHRLVMNVGVPEDFDVKVWGSMYYLDAYYDLVAEGILPRENFDSAFFSYLDHGVPVDPDRLWKRQSKKKNAWIHRIKKIFKR